MAYHGKYNSPNELIRDRSLSHSERMAMLESWRDDKEALLRASEEGMCGEVRLDYLGVIEKALKAA
tara:strand:- start:12552 stop:12749 length:198 start_codon:yes stop_codon:yes gene_type:complete